MAKAQLVARLAVELAPSSPLSAIIRRRRRAWAPRKVLDTIAEEETVPPAPPLHRNVTGAGSSAHDGAEKRKRCAGCRNDSSVAHGEMLVVLASAPAKAGCLKIAA
ncbi:unnamed protein product [Alopecurus aequalis]